MTRFFFFAIIISIFVSCNVSNSATQAEAKTDNTQQPSATKISLARLDSTQIMEDVKYLASDELGGRETDTKGGELAQAFIAKRFNDLGLEKYGEDFFQPFSFTTKKGKVYNAKNIVGKIEGSKHKNKYIILTAHYDHLGIKRAKIYNGADDNASGVAAIMAAAKYFKKNPPQHSILFVAFDAEELGLRGAYHFVDQSPIALENMMLNINLDMISRNTKNEIYLCGTYHYPILKEKLATIDEVSDLHVRLGHDSPDLGYNNWTNSSDHAPFHAKKIPFLYMGVEDHEDYHKHTDTFEKIDPAFLYRSSNLLIDLILTFDK